MSAVTQAWASRYRHEKQQDLAGICARSARKARYLNGNATGGEVERVGGVESPAYAEEGHRPPPVCCESDAADSFSSAWVCLARPDRRKAWFEVSLYRDFAGLGNVERIPERLSILRFRHLLEEHKLAQQIQNTINAMLAAEGRMLRSGTLVDAALIAASISTKTPLASKP